MKKSYEGSNKKKSLLAILITIAIITICATVGGFFVYQNVFAPKISYNLIASGYIDIQQDEYPEKEEYFTVLKSYEGMDFSETIEAFQTTSKSISYKIECVAPYFLHFKMEYKNRQNVKTLNKQINTTKQEYVLAFNELGQLINSYQTSNEQTPSKQASIQNFYYQSFLPKYLDYIKAKNDLANFLFDDLVEKNVLVSSSKNLIDLESVITDFSINYALPSIYYTKTEDLDFVKIITSTNNEMISLAKLNDEFVLLKTANKFQSDKTKNENFVSQLLLIKQIEKSANQIFENLSATQKRNFISQTKNSIKSKGSNTLEKTLNSIFDEESGSFFNAINNSNILEYF